MQGLVYGPRLIDAQPYPGVLEFFSAAVRQGIEVRIISHKTKHPFLGEPHDLHAAAWGWLESRGFFDPERIGIRRDQVFLELTKESKHQRIGSLGCTHFIDDLPEFLLDPGFPQGTERIHFDPYSTATPGTGLRSAQSWRQIHSELLANPAVVTLAHSVLGGNAVTFSPVSGGANNRICHARSASGEVIIKAYHHSTADQRDRFDVAIVCVGDAFAFSVIHGRKLGTEEVTAEDVRQCIDWVCALQKLEGSHLSTAADACLTLQEHVALIERRVQRLLDAESDHAAFKSFVVDELAPQVQRITSGIDIRQPAPPRVLSPSDFGFHNILKDAHNTPTTSSARCRKSPTMTVCLPASSSCCLCTLPNGPASCSMNF